MSCITWLLGENPDSYIDSYLHKVCNLALNSDEGKYLILETPPTAKYYYISYMCIDVWGSVQMYRVYRHMGGCMGHTNIQGTYRFMGVYRCMGVYTEVLGTYRCMKIYRYGE